jgi:hypothetical protein
MSTGIEKAERRSGEMAMTAERWERFLNRLGDPTEWEHTGIVNDLGKPTGTCICGHPIQFEFEIQNTRTGEKAHVGSVCVDHFAEISPVLYARLVEARTALEDRIEAEKRAAREVAKAAEVEAARIEWEAAAAPGRKMIADCRAEGRRIPSELYWMARKTANFRGPKTYKRACDYIRWYAGATKAVRSLEAVTAGRM